MTGCSGRFSRAPTAALDFDDPISVLRWLTDLRVAWLDANAVTSDMLAPLRARKLGPAECRRLYSEASFQLDQLIHHAMRTLTTDDGGEHGDPSGNGGAGPVH